MEGENRGAPSEGSCYGLKSVFRVQSGVRRRQRPISLVVAGGRRPHAHVRSGLLTENAAKGLSNPEGHERPLCIISAHLKKRLGSRCCTGGAGKMVYTGRDAV